MAPCGLACGQEPPSHAEEVGFEPKRTDGDPLRCQSLKDAPDGLGVLVSPSLDRDDRVETDADGIASGLDTLRRSEPSLKGRCSKLEAPGDAGGVHAPGYDGAT